MIALYGPFYRKAIADAGWESVTEAVREAWSDGDKAAAVEAVPDALLDDVVAAGTPEKVREVIERFEAIEEVDAVQIGLFEGMDDSERRRTLEALSPS
jgi:alkanesulfonate monooxygenase SsuD/methylene tetrahydromethanopterin reductase-like flavin-dependent oxidoreductase (luciferase family)